MAMIDTPRTAPFGAISTFRAVTSITSLVETVTRNYREWQERRRTARELALLTPDMLDDIGLTSADVDSYRIKAGLL